MARTANSVSSSNVDNWTMIRFSAAWKFTDEFLRVIVRARRRRIREAFGVVSHNDGLSTDDEQNNLETTKFNSSRGMC